MSTFYIVQSQIHENTITIQGEDVNHIKNVQRHKIGDILEICDNNENRYEAKISEFLSDNIVLDIKEKKNISNEPKIQISLFQGLPKSDKMDLIVQKAVEIGAKEIIPVIMDRTVVKIDKANTDKKVERWQKIAAEAAKQSYRQVIPIIQNIVNLENIVENLSKYDIVILPYECEKERTLKIVLKNLNKKINSVAIVIGPEGGFSEKDIKKLEVLPNVEKVSLGRRILRTETAGIVTMSMIIYEYDF